MNAVGIGVSKGKSMVCVIFLKSSLDFYQQIFLVINFRYKPGNLYMK